MNQTILVTGGAGYIGSHTCVQLLEAGYQVIIVDNLSNSSKISLERIETITGKKPDFYNEDIRNTEALDTIFSSNHIDAVIHFAGLKAVGESVEIPLEYYDNNIHGTLSLCQVMKKYNVKKMIFSSSATVYGTSQDVPFSEDAPTSATNPYGRSKLFIEEIMQDMSKSDPQWQIILLRYFNPVGAHKSGLIGEDPRGIPNNLMPYIAQVAVGRLKILNVFGNDYPTADGTGVRDYIHVVDLAKGHVKALNYITQVKACEIINLGTGNGISVLQMVAAFSRASKKDIPYQIKPRRTGDIATCYADPKKAERLLNWKAELSIDDMTKDTWNWQTKNPNGYE